MNYRLHPLGENAVMIELGNEINIETQQKVQFITSLLDDFPPKWMIEYTPAFTTVTIFYHPMEVMEAYQGPELPYAKACSYINDLLKDLTLRKSVPTRVVEVPVCYGGEYGPDLEHVAKINNLSTDDVIHLHSSGDYLVYMIGFAPGFPYVGGMSAKIAAPRRESPRLKIPARTVGIAGMQTGIYPIETPGGWQLIGRTPLELFQPDQESPSLLKAGDKLKFFPINKEEYLELERK